MHNKIYANKFTRFKLIGFNFLNCRLSWSCPLVALIMLFNVQPATAEDGLISQTWLAVKTELTDTWQSPNSELYIPINT